MKLLVLVLLAIGTFAQENYGGPEYAEIDQAKVVPVEDLPGFWDNRELPTPNYYSPPNVRNRRIVGGRIAEPNSIPWVVALHHFTARGVGLCGGAVLSTNAVLTAAHCPYGSGRTTVIAGAHNRTTIEPNQQRRTVSPSGYRLHPNFSMDRKPNDIAILIVPTPWTHNQYVQPTRLPTAFRNELFVGERATVSGWGFTTNTGGSSDVLRVAVSPVITNAECERAFTSGSIVASSLCTASNHGQGSCNGDSGGPLTVPRPGDSRPIHIGIVAFGAKNNCVGTWPNAFERTTYHLTWINQNH